MNPKANKSSGVDYQIQLEIIRSGFVPGQTHCWVHARAGIVRQEPPAVVVTMQPLQLRGSDIFFALSEMRTDDFGKSWKGPVMQSSLGRRTMDNDIEIAISDFTPGWHKATGTLLGTGHTVAYKGDTIYRPGRKNAYSVYDAQTQKWNDWRTFELPQEFATPGAGCTQRVDLENGDILLPIYYAKETGKYPVQYYSTILKCQYNGVSMQYIEHGSEISLNRGRGYYEPSLTKFKDRFYLTMRADDTGAVAGSADGLHFDAPKDWTWDDGSFVPTYNTQQHWVTHSDGLFLVYTRKADSNDHVFRHRAPLFIAEVDTERLCLIRASERILVPDTGARLGNFGVVTVNEHESWVIATEWMQNGGPWGEEMWRKLRMRYTEEELTALYDLPGMSGAVAKYGADNRTYAAKICWDRPNRLMELQ